MKMANKKNSCAENICFVYDTKGLALSIINADNTLNLFLLFHLIKKKNYPETYSTFHILVRNKPK